MPKKENNKYPNRKSAKNIRIQTGKANIIGLHSEQQKPHNKDQQKPLSDNVIYSQSIVFVIVIRFSILNLSPSILSEPYLLKSKCQTKKR